MLNDLIKVEGHAELARDPHSGAIINTSRIAYNAYMEKSRAIQERQKEFENTKTELNSIKKELDELKMAVHKLLNKDQE